MTGTGFAHECRALGVMAMQPFRERASQGSNWLTWDLLCLAAVAPLLGGYFSGKWAPSFALGAGIPLGMLAAMWWMMLVTSVVRQNHPAAFALVPGLRRRSLLVLLSFVVLVAATMMPLLALIGVAPSLTLLAVVLLCTATALGVFVPPLWSVAIACSLANVVLPWLGMQGVLDWLYAQPWWATSAALLLLCAAITYRHVKGVRRGERTGLAARGASLPVLYRRALRRDCATGDALSLSLHVLGPRGHALNYLVLVVAGYAVLALVGLTQFDTDSIWRPLAKFFVIAWAVGIHYRTASRLQAAIDATRTPQALVGLTPGALQGGVRNRAVAAALLRQFLLMWGVSAAGSLMLLLILGGSTAAVLDVAVVFIMSLAPGGMLLRDLASGAPPSRLARFGGALWLLATGVVALLALNGWPGQSGAFMPSLILIFSLLVVAGWWKTRCALFHPAPSAKGPG